MVRSSAPAAHHRTQHQEQQEQQPLQEQEQEQPQPRPQQETQQTEEATPPAAVTAADAGAEDLSFDEKNRMLKDILDEMTPHGREQLAEPYNLADVRNKASQDCSKLLTELSRDHLEIPGIHRLDFSSAENKRMLTHIQDKMTPHGREPFSQSQLNLILSISARVQNDKLYRMEIPKIRCLDLSFAKKNRMLKDILDEMTPHGREQLAKPYGLADVRDEASQDCSKLLTELSRDHPVSEFFTRWDIKASLNTWVGVSVTLLMLLGGGTFAGSLLYAGSLQCHAEHHHATKTILGFGAAAFWLGMCWAFWTGRNLWRPCTYYCVWVSRGLPASWKEKDMRRNLKEIKACTTIKVRKSQPAQGEASTRPVEASTGPAHGENCSALVVFQSQTEADNLVASGIDQSQLSGLSSQDTTKTHNCEHAAWEKMDSEQQKELRPYFVETAITRGNYLAASYLLWTEREGGGAFTIKRRELLTKTLMGLRVIYLSMLGWFVIVACGCVELLARDDDADYSRIATDMARFMLPHEGCVPKHVSEATVDTLIWMLLLLFVPAGLVMDNFMYALFEVVVLCSFLVDDAVGDLSRTLQSDCSLKFKSKVKKEDGDKLYSYLSKDADYWESEVRQPAIKVARTTMPILNLLSPLVAHIFVIGMFIAQTFADTILYVDSKVDGY